MNKNFDKWNEIKKRINNIVPSLNFKEREVWFSFVGVNVRFEEDGKGEDFMRPVVIVKKFSKEMFLGIPCTTIEKDNPFYVYIGNFKGNKNFAILSQIRLYSASRLAYKIGVISE